MSFLSIEGLTKPLETWVSWIMSALRLKKKGFFPSSGPTGPGKTTFFNLLTGFTGRQRPDDPERCWDITHRPPHENIKEGISRAFQVASLFNEMTVLEQHPHPGVQSYLGVKGRLFSRFEDNVEVRKNQ